MQRHVPAAHKPLPGSSPSLPGLPLSHGLELCLATLFHLDGPAVGRRPAPAHHLTTTLVVVGMVGVVGVGVGVNQWETKGVHRCPMKTAVFQSSRALWVNPGTLHPLVVEGGRTTREGRGLMGVWCGEEWL